jgi:hypothetical protein
MGLISKFTEAGGWEGIWRGMGWGRGGRVWGK